MARGGGWDDFVALRDKVAAALPELAVRGCKPAGEPRAADGSLLDVWLLRPGGAGELRDTLVWSRTAQPEPRQPEPGEVRTALAAGARPELARPGQSAAERSALLRPGSPRPPFLGPCSPTLKQ